ncbi:MAG: hypothetical protein ACOC0M_05495, partial [Halomonas sp.]
MARTDSPDDLLLWIQKATAPVTGGAYFRSLVQRLAESLGIRVALIAECLDDALAGSAPSPTGPRMASPRTSS